MRICDVVLNSVWFDPRVRKQINQYISSGADLTCVGTKCIRYDKEKVSQVPCEVILLEEKPKSKGVIGRALGKIGVIRKMRKALIDKKPDLIHANDIYGLIPSFLAKKVIKCKVVYDAHEINTENYTTNRIEKLLFGFIEKYMSRRIDQMVCVSNAAADYFAKKYSIDKPMVVTNCTLASEICLSDKKNCGFEILNHGQFYQGRGYDIMIEAIPILSEYPEIKVALRGMGKLESQLRTRAAEIGGENIRFYPPVHVSRLIPEASSSHVGVAITEAICLNFKLSVSNKLFEYASAGLPVIMSDIPEHRHLNDKYNFGIIMEDNTPESFAKAAIALYTDKTLYSQLSANAVKMSKDLNWESEFSKLLNIENQLVSVKEK